jgi:hypothetical protein
LVAESISKETPHIFIPKRWNRFFAIYVVRLALYVCLKNICDGVGRLNGSNGTPLDPLFFGWTISLRRSDNSIQTGFKYLFPQLFTKNAQFQRFFFKEKLKHSAYVYVRITREKENKRNKELPANVLLFVDVKGWLVLAGLNMHFPITRSSSKTYFYVRLYRLAEKTGVEAL